MPQRDNQAERAAPVNVALAEIATRLKRLDALQQERLINWGYAVCDAAMRRHMNEGFVAPDGFPVCCEPGGLSMTHEADNKDVNVKRAVFARAAVILLIAVLPVGSGMIAQSAAPSEIAAKLSGHWRLNADLTPVSAKPGRGRGQASFAVSRAPVQRGGRGGGGAGGGQPGGDASSPLMPEEVAAQAALTILHQVPVEVTIEATTESVTFREPRGEWHFKIDGKNNSMDVPGGTLHSKSKWDHATLRQEFSSAQKKLVKSWAIDVNDRLVLTERFESATTSNSESKAVFDRQ